LEIYIHTKHTEVHIIHIKRQYEKEDIRNIEDMEKIHTKWSKTVHTIKKNTEGKNAESPGGETPERNLIY